METRPKRPRRGGLRAGIVSTDKDLAQLVGDKIELLDTMSRDGGPPRRFDRAGVIARFGVSPERIVDYLMLVGDSVDHVPGGEQVGPKPAAGWPPESGLPHTLAPAPRALGTGGNFDPSVRLAKGLRVGRACLQHPEVRHFSRQVRIGADRD